ncbi:MAG: zinc ribbon domain-containing protein [Candidatus Omnitrophota bacterium]|nr:zinc ribbon domain-containing protein [Candidatus Omnitrophota bacterium]
MPTYEYQCKKCRRRHEAFQSITAKPLRRCPSCKGTLERLMGSGSGFLFRGSGFYVTDYRSRSYREAQQKEKPPSSPAAPATPPTSAGDKGCAGGSCAAGRAA